MIGTRLQDCRPFPTAAALLLMTAVLCSTATVISHVPGWAIFSILPASIGAVLLIMRPRRVCAELTTAGLYLPNKRENIAYEQITRLWCAHLGPLGFPAAIYVTHLNGITRIPLNDRSQMLEVHAFIESKIPRHHLSNVNQSLQGYWQLHALTFGRDRAWAHNAKPNLADRSRRRSICVILPCHATAWAWMIIGVSTKSNGLAGCGGLLFLITAVAFLVWYLCRQLSMPQIGIRKWRDSSVVVSPAGLALAQGDLTGELLWDEIRSLRLKDGSFPRNRRIELDVDGAQVQVRDIYNTPLAEIYRQVERYWLVG